jgi:hypothetical protein
MHSNNSLFEIKALQGPDFSIPEEALHVHKEPSFNSWQEEVSVDRFNPENIHKKSPHNMLRLDLDKQPEITSEEIDTPKRNHFELSGIFD